MDFNKKFKIKSEELEKALGVPFQESPPPCPHEEAIDELLFWVAKEMANEPDYILRRRHAGNIASIVNAVENAMGSFCLAWTLLITIEDDEELEPHPIKDKLVAKMKELDIEVERKHKEQSNDKA